MLKNIFYKYLCFFLPKLTLQKLKLGDVYICTLNDNLMKKDNIFNAQACGADSCWETTKSKALSEYVERKSFELSQVQSTNGFAAYPFIFRKKRAQKKARENACFEMIERYAWPEWFGNKNIHYTLKNDVENKNKKFLQAIQREINISKLYIISPQMEQSNLKMVILYGVTNAGLVCASSVRNSIESAEQSALKEFYMHAVGLYRIKNHILKTTMNYEARIVWISEQSHLLNQRLTFCGTHFISIPYPIVYQDIPTEFNQAYIVQRCFFQGYDDQFFSKENKMYI